MAYSIEVYSKVMGRDDYMVKFEKIIQILKNHHIEKVEILFGIMWGNDYKNWTPYYVAVYEIRQEIKTAEKLGFGLFGDNDFYIILEPFETEILFCHESDIHLLYNNENALVKEILQYWEENNLIL